MPCYCVSVEGKMKGNIDERLTIIKHLSGYEVQWWKIIAHHFKPIQDESVRSQGTSCYN